MVSRPFDGVGSIFVRRVVVVTLQIACSIACSIALAGAVNPETPVAAAADAAFEAAEYARAAELLEAHLRAFPDDAGRRRRLGWSHYRMGEFEKARRHFAEAVDRDTSDLRARVGLSYARLQLGELAEAARGFRAVLEIANEDVDAELGLLLAAQRGALEAPEARAASELAEEVLRDGDASRSMRRAAWAVHAAFTGEHERRRRPPIDEGEPLRVPSRARERALEISGVDDEFEPVFVKGFNLGTALPGRFPTQFPQNEAVYRDWLATMSDLGANAVRLYTLLPPSFYRALVAHNEENPEGRVWLIQGVWTELPPDHDFGDPSFVDGFEAEIARVLDAVHGNLLLAPRPGHASGIYDTDASEHLLAAIIGREWEPFAVAEYEALEPGRETWRGEYFVARRARAMERWVAQRCEFAARHLAETYRTLVPLAFANWPTLDPLHHPTESSRHEEDEWREHYGIETVGRLAAAAWNNDEVEIDATKIRPTRRNPAGFFAAYHIYPNYPDFFNLDATLAEERGASRPTRYAGYLHRLAEYHGDQPILVAEFGISTSRGVAHVQPEGWHHGGHDERRQGELVGEMIRTIHEEGYAGGVVFSFLDEWFKGTWSVAPLEIPAERRRIWFNAESPEQSYGFLAARPASSEVVVDGRVDEWGDIEPVARADDGPREAPGGWRRLRALRLDADEGYLYVALETEGRGTVDWSRTAFRLAIDTYDDVRGERRTPPPGSAPLPTGVEFVVELRGPSASRLLVSAPYEPYDRLESGRIASPSEPSGRFVPLFFEANRERFGRDGTRYPPVDWERGKLRWGSLAPRARDFDTRTDVSVGESGVVEVRLPWALIGFTDPSTRRVLHADGTEWTRMTEGLRVYAFALDPSDPEAAPTASLPPAGRPSPRWSWPAWNVPEYRLELKHGAPLLREAWSELDGGGGRE